MYANGVQLCCKKCVHLSDTGMLWVDRRLYNNTITNIEAGAFDGLTSLDIL